MHHIARLLRERRAALGLSAAEVARRTPYRDPARGAQRLLSLEAATWTPDRKVVDWFARALQLPPAAVEAAWEADHPDDDLDRDPRPPADTCAVCGRPPSPPDTPAPDAHAAGRRLTATLRQALVLQSALHDIGRGWHEVHAVLSEDAESPCYVVMAGFGWREDVLERARAAADAGRRPWFCQRCAGQVCGHCGTPYRFVPGSSYLDDDGRTRYAALLPIGSPRCADPACPGSRPPEDKPPR